MIEKVKLHNPQALFNMIRIMEDYLIGKSIIFTIFLLPVDIVIASALFVSYIERMFAYKVVDKFLRYIHYDLTYLKEICLMILKKDYVSKELTEEIHETKISGKLYQRLKRILKFFWNIVVFLFVFPVLPILWCYNFLAPKILIGALYYFILFHNLHIVLEIYLFGFATFLIASTTVPFLFEVFVYIKYLFELKRKTFDEIQTEAKMFYLNLYKYNISEENLKEEDDEEKVEGGLYYLFLVFLHSIKDKTLDFINSVFIMKKGKASFLQKLNIKKITNEVIETRSKQTEVNLRNLIVPFIALIFTFVIAYILVFAGTHGKGILASLTISVVNKQEAIVRWGNFEGSRLGYFGYRVETITLIPRFFRYIALILDNIFYYLFLAWHILSPIYMSFIIIYYKWIFKNIFGMNIK